jgi:glycosyltransferase involved in cell wall biosynthesis
MDADLVGRLDALERRLEALTRLVARSYERQEGWAERLVALRETCAYAAAFEGDPLVTVRIGTYCGADTLITRALASVRRQTYPHWEAIVVGDATPDDTAERIAALGDERIRFVNRPFNGPYPDRAEERWLVAGTYPFNEGAAMANGAWIAPIDQDDEWSDDHLELLLRAAQRARAELAYGAMRAVVDGTRIETWFGVFPPCLSDFGFQAAIYHAELRDFRYDVAAALVAEPGDWNLARRMWEAGVRFHFLNRLVGTYHVDADAPSVDWWRQRAASRGAWPEGAGQMV